MKYLFLIITVLSTACSDDSGEKSTQIPVYEVDASVDQSADDGVKTYPGMLACDSPSGVCPLTCEVLTDPSFCWNLIRPEIKGCGDSENLGVMSADGLTCTTSEVVVEFAEPLVVGVLVRDWAFKISRDGESCLEYSNDSSTSSMTTQTGTVKYTSTYSPSYSYRFDCPDGGVWQTSEQSVFLNCERQDGLPLAPASSSGVKDRISEFGLNFDQMFACEFE